MIINISVDVKIDSKRIRRAIMNDAAFWTFAATEWHRLYKDYVPMDSGTLYRQVNITPGQIEHTAPYAHYQYTGELYGPNYPIMEGGRAVSFFSKRGQPKHKMGKSLKYSTQLHPKASKEWDKAAEPTQKPLLISSLQKYIDQGRIKLT